jgi:hypothetical protein
VNFSLFFLKISVEIGIAIPQYTSKMYAVSLYSYSYGRISKEVMYIYICLQPMIRQVNGLDGTHYMLGSRFGYIKGNGLDSLKILQKALL